MTGIPFLSTRFNPYLYHQPLASTHVAVLGEHLEARTKVDREVGIVVTQHIPHVLHNRVPVREWDTLIDGIMLV